MPTPPLACKSFRQRRTIPRNATPPSETNQLPVMSISTHTHALGSCGNGSDIRHMCQTLVTWRSGAGCLAPICPVLQGDYGGHAGGLTSKPSKGREAPCPAPWAMRPAMSGAVRSRTSAWDSRQPRGSARCSGWSSARLLLVPAWAGAHPGCARVAQLRGRCLRLVPDLAAKGQPSTACGWRSTAAARRARSASGAVMRSACRACMAATSSACWRHWR